MSYIDQYLDEATQIINQLEIQQQLIRWLNY